MSQTASINMGLWAIALPFGYYATQQVVKRFNELEQIKVVESQKEKELEFAETSSPVHPSA